MNQQKLGAARVSVISNSLLVVAKMVIGIIIGSVSIMAEAIHSGIDLAAAIIAYFSISEASKPADPQHQYGHGKIENLSGTIEALLIFIAALWIIAEAVTKFKNPAPLESVGAGLLIMAVSSVVNWLVSDYLMKAGGRTDSIALKADAMHLRTDVYTSAGVMAGLGLIKLTGLHWIDPLVAILVALLIFRTSWELTVEALVPLLDISLPKEEISQIEQILESYRPRILDYHKIRTRKAGPERHVDLHLLFPPQTTIEVAHDLASEVEERIESTLPNTRVLIHIEPAETIGNSPKFAQINRYRIFRTATGQEIKVVKRHLHPSRNNDND